MRREFLAGLLKAAVQNEQLDPALNRQIDHRPRCPAFQTDALASMLEQRGQLDAREIRCWRESECESIDAQLGSVVRVELPELDENRTTRLGTGRVAAGWRVANVSARRIVAVLVLEDAVEHQELLAPAMGVRRETTVRGVANDRGRARHLIPDAVEHSPFDPGDGRPCPV